MEEKIQVLFSEKMIDERIRKLGKQISEEYAGKEIKLICVLRGSSVFFCELAKRITVPVTFDFISVSSYGNGTESGSQIRIRKDLDEPIDGQHVIVVEDIIDTGKTLTKLMELLRQRGAKSLRLAALLDKKERRQAAIEADYTGFQIDDGFVVGYGLDYAQKYRNLPYIGIVQLS